MGFTKDLLVVAETVTDYIAFDEHVVLRGGGGEKVDKVIKLIMEDEEFRALREQLHEEHFMSSMQGDRAPEPVMYEWAHDQMRKEEDGDRQATD